MSTARQLRASWIAGVLDVASILAGPALHVGSLRRWALGRGERALHRLADPASRLPTAEGRIGTEHRLLATALLRTVDRLAARGALAPRVIRRAGGLWARALHQAFSADVGSTLRAFQSGHHGRRPPWFLVISPLATCNLSCVDCYADAGAAAPQLAATTVDRLIDEARAAWDAPLFVISGGEPFLYRSEGRDLIDLLAAHPDSLFLVFSNGTLIDRRAAARLARIGNATVALSLEGSEESTDRRRGRGIYRRVVRTMELLGQHGVPFGVSLTVTADNIEEVLSDRFLDATFSVHGAFYGFLFQWMPIGRGVEGGLHRMPTPAQRLALWQRMWEVIEYRGIFLFDFWNSGTLTGGCIAAGRDGGYLHVDWRGAVTPCVFAPFPAASIHAVHANGGTISDVLFTPLLKAFRAWQRGYGAASTPPLPGADRLRPCPVRDHCPSLLATLADAGVPDAGARLSAATVAHLAAYGRELARSTGPIWRREYLNLNGCGRNSDPGD